MTTENAEKDVFSFCKPVAKVCSQVRCLPCTEVQDAIPVSILSFYVALRINFSHCFFRFAQDDGIMFFSVQSYALT